MKSKDKKEVVKKEKKSKAPEIEKGVIWEYAHDADLTIGETKISNTAKVILILLLIALIGSGIFAYLKRDFVFDYIKQPEIVLSMTEDTIEVGDTFNYKKYIVDNDYLDRWKITYPDNNEVDTSKLGDYTVQYKLQSLANESISTLVIHVVDTTSPKLELTNSTISLERGEQTEKFDAKSYIKHVSDNYDKEKDIKVTFTEVIDWTKEIIEIDYVAEDKSGNITNAVLSIVVTDPPKEPEIIEVEKPVYIEVPVQSGGSNNSGSSGNSSGSSGNSSSGNSSSGNSSSSSSSSSSQSSKPYINGVHDFSVKVGDLASFTSQVQSGISGSGYVTIDYSSVNLTVPGVYTVTYSSSDGVTKTANVTVYE